MNKKLGKIDLGPNSNFVNSNNPLIGSPSAQVSSSFDASVDSFSSPVYTAAADDSNNFVSSTNFAPEEDFGSSSFTSESNNFQSGSSGSSSFSPDVQPASNFGSSSFGSSGSFASSGNSGSFSSSGNGENFFSSGNSGNFASPSSSALDIRSNSFQSQQGNGFAGSSSSSSNTRNSPPVKGIERNPLMTSQILGHEHFNLYSYDQSLT